MGQQQLLLLVLGIVIVGLSVVAGINAFAENQQRSSRDALVNEAVRIATDVQAWKIKPTSFGGGGGSFAPGGTQATLEDMGIAPAGAGDTYTTPWGVVVYTVPGDGTFTLTDLQNNPAGVVTLSDATGAITYAAP